MKKAFLGLAVLTAMFLMISCGDEDTTANPQNSSLVGTACSETDTFKCEQDEKVVLKCEDGAWKKIRLCSEGQKCNADNGECDTENNNGNNEEETNDDEQQPATQCGNHNIETGEICDGDAKECSAVDASFTGGYASCKPDCSGYDTTACTSGGNGGGGNGGSTDTACADLANCFFSCQDQACADACVNSCQSQEAYNNFGSLYNCLKNNNCQQVNCQQCANEYNTCMTGNGGNGGNGGSSSGYCYDIFQCYVNAQTDDAATACYNSGNQEGQALFMEAYNCWFADGSTCQSYDCAECSAQYNACINNKGGNGGGNGGSGSAITTCSDFANCFFSCQDQSCADACSDRLQSQDAYNNFGALYNCLKNNGCQQVNCQQCSNEYNTCMSN